MLYPFSTKALRLPTAKSGVPINTMRISFADIAFFNKDKACERTSKHETEKAQG
jgi:hypothetical protein